MVKKTLMTAAILGFITGAGLASHPEATVEQATRQPPLKSPQSTAETSTVPRVNGLATPKISWHYLEERQQLVQKQRW